MSQAWILLAANARCVTVPELLEAVTRLGVPCRAGEWRFLTEAVPQVEIAGNPSLALQVNDDAETIVEETAEAMEDGKIEGTLEELDLFRHATCRIEVVSGELPSIHTLPDGGIASYTQSANIELNTVDLLQRIATSLGGKLVLLA